MGNENLIKAKKAKNDEFYTQLSDVDSELSLYVDEDGNSLFKDKIVYCNCDDCYKSNFFLWFAMNFKKLGLKKLMASCYFEAPPPFIKFSFFDPTPEKVEKKPAYKVEITGIEDYNGNGEIDREDVFYHLANTDSVSFLKGDGDFRSEECLALLDESDVVVTNPPFSLFRDFVATMTEHNKPFAVIGSMNAITYREVFPLIRDGIVQTGFNFSRAFTFVTPEEDHTTDSAEEECGEQTLCNIAWFTSLPIRKPNSRIDLVFKYEGNESAYPRYSNYNAIEVSRTADIPFDYKGIMGVPITFIDKYCPEQFEIIDTMSPEINGEKVYKRIAIRNRAYNEEVELIPPKKPAQCMFDI